MKMLADVVSSLKLSARSVGFSTEVAEIWQQMADTVMWATPLVNEALDRRAQTCASCHHWKQPAKLLTDAVRCKLFDIVAMPTFGCNAHVPKKAE